MDPNNLQRYSANAMGASAPTSERLPLSPDAAGAENVYQYGAARLQQSLRLAGLAVGSAPFLMLPDKMLPLVGISKGANAGRMALGGAKAAELGTFADYAADATGFFGRTARRASYIGRLGARGTAASVLGGAASFGVKASLLQIPVMLGQSAAENMIEGSKQYVATREFGRELSSGMSPWAGGSAFNTESHGLDSALSNLHDVGRNEQFQSMIGGFADKLGISDAQMRNLTGKLDQSGILGNVQSISDVRSSLTKNLSTLKKISQAVHTDINHAIQVYKDLDSMGFKGEVDKIRELKELTGLSDLTGMSIGSISNVMKSGAASARRFGQEGEVGVHLAQRLLGSASLGKYRGTISEDYLDEVGGVAGYAKRMTQLRMGLGSTTFGLATVSQMYDTAGNRKSFEGLTPQISDWGTLSRDRSFLRSFDPYKLNKMKRNAGPLMGSMLLSSLEKVRAEGDTAAESNRLQYRFMSNTLGISSPQEQLEFKKSLTGANSSSYLSAIQNYNNPREVGVQIATRVVDSIKKIGNEVISGISTPVTAWQEGWQHLGAKMSGRRRPAGLRKETYHSPHHLTVQQTDAASERYTNGFRPVAGDIRDVRREGLRAIAITDPNSDRAVDLLRRRFIREHPNLMTMSEGNYGPLAGAPQDFDPRDYKDEIANWRGNWRARYRSEPSPEELTQASLKMVRKEQNRTLAEMGQQPISFQDGTAYLPVDREAASRGDNLKGTRAYREAKADALRITKSLEGESSRGYRHELEDIKEVGRKGARNAPLQAMNTLASTIGAPSLHAYEYYTADNGERRIRARPTASERVFVTSHSPGQFLNSSKAFNGGYESDKEMLSGGYEPSTRGLQRTLRALEARGGASVLRDVVQGMLQERVKSSRNKNTQAYAASKWAQAQNTTVGAVRALTGDRNFNVTGSKFGSLRGYSASASSHLNEAIAGFRISKGLTDDLGGEVSQATISKLHELAQTKPWVAAAAVKKYTQRRASEGADYVPNLLTKLTGMEPGDKGYEDFKQMTEFYGDLSITTNLPVGGSTPGSSQDVDDLVSRALGDSDEMEQQIKVASAASFRSIRGSAREDILGRIRGNRVRVLNSQDRLDLVSDTMKSILPTEDGIKLPDGGNIKLRKGMETLQLLSSGDLNYGSLSADQREDLKNSMNYLHGHLDMIKQDKLRNVMGMVTSPWSAMKGDGPNYVDQNMTMMTDQLVDPDTGKVNANALLFGGTAIPKIGAFWNSARSGDREDIGSSSKQWFEMVKNAKGKKFTTFMDNMSEGKGTSIDDKKAFYNATMNDNLKSLGFDESSVGLLKDLLSKGMGGYSESDQQKKEDRTKKMMDNVDKIEKHLESVLASGGDAINVHIYEPEAKDSSQSSSTSSG